MKKLITFSLWGDSPTYTRGAVHNIKRRHEFYPNWTIRVYYDDTVPSEAISQLRALDDTVEWCKQGQTEPGLGLFWRFHTMWDDPDVERFIVRDFDSFYSDREVAAVKEWEEYGSDWHIMRDNPAHGIQMLGGTWGAKAGCMPEFQSLMSRFFAGPMQKYVSMNTKNERGLYHGTDQCFLCDFIWPCIKMKQLAHITEGNEKLRFSPTDRYFPVPMKDGHYVGMVYTFPEEE